VHVTCIYDSDSYRLEDNIKMDWINLDQDRDNWLAFANEVKNL